MTRQDSKHYARKHPSNLKTKPEIVRAVKGQGSQGEISCAAAFKIAEELNIAPHEVGFTIDSLEIKITYCQLGIFGYGPGKSRIRPMDKVPENLKEAITTSIIDGRLPCKAAWEIAKRLGMGKREVTSACETLEIKISSCQLGAF